jgi:hypothetical protein
MSFHAKSRISLRSIRATKKQKEAERRQTLSHILRAMGRGTASARTLPRKRERTWEGQLACRRSTAALAKGTRHPKGSASGQVSWDAV